MAEREGNAQECRAGFHNRELLAHSSHLVDMENYSGQQIKRLKSCILPHQGDKGCHQSKHSVPIFSALPWASSLGSGRTGAIQGLGLSSWACNPVSKTKTFSADSVNLSKLTKSKSPFVFSPWLGGHQSFVQHLLLYTQRGIHFHLPQLVPDFFLKAEMPHFS